MQKSYSGILVRNVFELLLEDPGPDEMYNFTIVFWGLTVSLVNVRSLFDPAVRSELLPLQTSPDFLLCCCNMNPTDIFMVYRNY